MKKFNNQKGLSLVEILVTLLIMAIGTLGIAALQLTGLKYSSGAAVRTQATLLANDLMDRMRANRTVAIDKTLYNTDGFQGADSFTSPATSCYTNVCNEDQMAEYDKWAWMQQVSALLPDGRAEVSFNEVDEQRVYSVSLQWRQVANEDRTDANDEIKQFTFRGAL